MTTPTTTSMPVVHYEAPPVNPSTSGLYLVSQLHEQAAGAPNRILGGIDVWPINYDTGWGTWPSDPCSTPDPGLLKAGVRSQPEDAFAPLEVWGWDECDPAEPVEAIKARALQNLRMHEQGVVEAHFANRLLADAGTLVSVPDLVAAIGELEVAIGETGTTGIIHLSMRYSSALDAAGIIPSSSSPIPRTRLGNALAFGGGYDAVLGSTLVATGPTTVWRSETFVQDTVDVDAHVRAALAERTVVAGYESLIAAVKVGTP